MPRPTHAGEHEALRHLAVLHDERDVLAHVVLDLGQLDGLVDVLVLGRRILSLEGEPELLQRLEIGLGGGPHVHDVHLSP